jgi:N-acetylglucosaminyldiphosphoundecaprenol N-acetyl-beta-D-mannosaminyltransferase
MDSDLSNQLKQAGTSMKEPLSGAQAAHDVAALRGADCSGIRRTNLFGVPIDAAGSLKDVVDAVASALGAGRTVLTTFINPAVFATIRQKPGFAATLSRFDLVLPDGVGIVMAVTRLRGLSLERISFDSTSLALPILELVDRTNRTVGLIGGAPGIAERAAEHLRSVFPALRLVAALDGYGDHSAKVRVLRGLQPDVVICGMGAIAQEEFLLALADSGWRGCGFTCGGYLDQLGAGLSYYPQWVDRSNLRWAYRLAREPRRLWRRYLIDYQQFTLLFAKEMLARRISRQKR